MKESDLMLHLPKALAEPLQKKGVSYWKDAWMRLCMNRPALFGLGVLLVMLSCAIIVPFLSPHTYYETHLAPLCPLLVWNR